MGARPAVPPAMRSDLPDDRPVFNARIETELLSLGQYRAILVMSTSGEDADEEIRVPLAGEHPTAREAELAARLAIAAMAGLGTDAD